MGRKEEIYIYQTINERLLSCLSCLSGKKEEVYIKQTSSELPELSEWGKIYNIFIEMYIIYMYNNMLNKPKLTSIYNIRH